MKPIHFIVTSGGTREPIDDVRYIGNSSTGRLGAGIARAAAARGHEVCLVHGTGSVVPSDLTGIRLREFSTARVLEQVLHEEVARCGSPCTVVMCAAVADYAPVCQPGKIPSNREEIVIHLRKVGKIVDLIKTWKPGLLLVKFKLESGRVPEQLIRIGLESMEQSDADLAVVNDIKLIGDGRHPAFLLWPDGRSRALEGKGEIAEAVVSAVEQLVPETNGDG